MKSIPLKRASGYKSGIFGGSRQPIAHAVAQRDSAFAFRLELLEVQGSIPGPTNFRELLPTFFDDPRRSGIKRICEFGVTRVNLRGDRITLYTADVTANAFEYALFKQL
jgi:hypothetical protein